MQNSPASSESPFLEIFKRQKACHARIKTTSAEERITKLRRLREAILVRDEELKAVLKKDLNKHPTEVDLTETFVVISEINFCIKNLKKWMKPVRAKTPITLFGTKSEIRYEPRGVILVIGPWNYPFQLMMVPVISAIAAGNCVILKPSELASETSHFLKKLISELFDEQEVACIEGDASASQALLKLPFDHIFFTGSTRLGKIVMEAAAKNLTSVTLELGGKSPAIIEESADLSAAAERLAWGKFLNAGQTCVAPDYVFIPKNRVSEFVDLTRQKIAQSYGESSEPKDLCKIINSNHFNRLKTAIDETVKQGGKLELGGKMNPQSQMISPTVMTQISWKHPIMQDEIFGPVLPVIGYENLEEVYQTLQQIEKPLALYIFSRKKQKINKILQKTSAGGTAINSAVIHLSNPNIPFGGVGQSGMGNYHGYFGFKTFSHERAVLTQGRINYLKMFLPPYKSGQAKIVKWLIRNLA